MAEHRTKVSSNNVGTKVLVIEAIGFVQGTDPNRRVSVDVQAETTRFEVVIRNRDGTLYERLVGGGNEWLTRDEAWRYAQGFLRGLTYA